MNSEDMEDGVRIQRKKKRETETLNKFVIISHELCLFNRQVTCRGPGANLNIFSQSLGSCLFGAASYAAAQAMCVCGGRCPQLLGG